MPAEERALTSGALFEDGEVAVIGESLQTPVSDGAIGECCVVRRRREPCRAKDAHGSFLPVCLTVKPVGELDAGNPHVQFDERGWETGRWP